MSSSHSDLSQDVVQVSLVRGEAGFDEEQIIPIPLQMGNRPSWSLSRRGTGQSDPAPDGIQVLLVHPQTRRGSV